MNDIINVLIFALAYAMMNAIVIGALNLFIWIEKKGWV